MKWLIAPANRRNIVVLFILLLTIALIVSACGGNGGETAGAGEIEGQAGTETEPEPDTTGLQEQQAEDIVLDPEALAASSTVFDPSITDPETLFITYCAKCHGLEGLGNGPSAGSLRGVGQGMNLTILQDRSDEEIFNTITGGKGAEMPPWGLVLTEEQRNILVAYIRTLGNE